MRKPILAAALCALSIGAAGAARADTFAWGLNDSGSVVGWYSAPDGYRGFLYSHGDYTSIGPVYIHPTGINNSGEITGWYQNTQTSFLYNSGSYTDLIVPGSIFTNAFGINNLGQVAGYTQDSGSHSFLYQGGAYDTFDLPMPGLVVLYEVNDAGELAGTNATGPSTVLGERGFVDDGGNITFVSFPGSTGTTVTSINNRGDVAGWYTAEGSSTHHGFVDVGGTFTTIDPPGAGLSEVYGVNDRGWLSGRFLDATGEHGFIDQDGTFTILDFPGSILPPPPPAPEPAEWALLITGMGLIGAHLRRRAKRGLAAQG